MTQNISQNNFATFFKEEDAYKTVKIINRPDFDTIRKNVIDKIENIIFNLCCQLVAGKIPFISYNVEQSYKNKENISYDDKNASQGNSSEEFTKTISNRKAVSFEKKDGRRKLALIMQVLQRIHNSLISGNNKFQTRRSLFYELKERVPSSALVKTQQCIDQIVKDVAEIVSCLEWDLNIVATSKGLAAGKLLCNLDDGTQLDFRVKKNGILISHNISHISSIKHDVKMILIVEKDAVFQKLLSEGCPELLNCLLITGKGYPDFATRRFVNIISKELNIPVYAIVDADPFGIDIMCAYRFGTVAQLRLREKLICPSIRWLGIHPTEIDGLNLKSVHKTALSPADDLKLKSLEKRAYLSESIRSELEELKKGKLEIEAIANYSDGFMSTVYLPMKINKGWYLR